MSGILQALDINGTFIFQVIDFVLLLVFLRIFVWPPLVKALEQRRQTVERELTAAEQERKLAVAERQEQLKALEEARAQAQAAVERAQRSAAEESKRLLGEAREQAERMQKRLAEEIEREREAAIASLRSEVASQVLAATDKLVRARVGANEDADRELVAEFIGDVGHKA